MGIRLALGSSISRAMLEVGRSGMTATLGGLALGVILSSLAARARCPPNYLAFSRTTRSLLAATTVILGGIAAAATLLPTVRISRMPLAETLITE